MYPDAHQLSLPEVVSDLLDVFLLDNTSVKIYEIVRVCGFFQVVPIKCYTGPHIDYEITQSRLSRGRIC